MAKINWSSKRSIQVISTPLYNINDLQTALNDLTIALRLSCIDSDGKINAYEKNGTANIIVLAITALAETRKNKI